METFTSLEDVGEQFKKSDDIENEALFMQGHIVKRAIEQGWNVDEVTGYCASLVMKTKRTVYRYYTVSRTFPNRMFDLPFEHHAIASDTIDYRKSMTDSELQDVQQNALEWLKIAKAGGYSTRALRAAISTAGGRVNEKPEVLLDGVEFEIYDYLVDSVGTNIELFIGHQIEALKDLGLKGTRVKVTLVRSLSERAIPS